ncbi:MAG: hypothetical protein H7A24_05000 [Leptospiraceae bacterium]|nr:hypothetical protein [Leptospiraceae bacterium]MCP5511214.1 hypothetical protein [Leptospiraceae bacterium]
MPINFSEIGWRDLNERSLRKEIFHGRIFHIQVHPEIVRSLFPELQKNLSLFFPDNFLNLRFSSQTTHTLLSRFRETMHSKGTLKTIGHSFLKKVLIENHSQTTNHILADLPRVRSLSPESHLDEKAKKAFYAHRDTWYANSPSQINLWIPLHPIDPSNSFVFFPEYFQRSVLNDSAEFKLGEFIHSGGFQNSLNTNSFPTTQEIICGGDSFYCDTGEAIVFSAHHLHTTSPNVSLKNRWSMEFRIVYSEDREQGLEAFELDNMSSGDFTESFSELI